MSRMRKVDEQLKLFYKKSRPIVFPYDIIREIADESCLDPWRS